jgi:hypothetical protein
MLASIHTLFSAQLTSKQLKTRKYQATVLQRVPVMYAKDIGVVSKPAQPKPVGMQLPLVSRR